MPNVLRSRLDRSGTGPGDAETIAALRALVEAQAAVIREQADALAHSKKIFDRASAAARIGVWECRLSDEALTWTDGVYDIFEFPRGTPVDRAQSLACYLPESRDLLEQVRAKAIEDRDGFCVDVAITTRRGNRRWIRITATIECENGEAVRIFGMKQDITEEKILSDRTRYLAEFDVLTGLANRSQFQQRLARFDDDCGDGERCRALALIDLDGFKQINDSFGHAVGDACLQDVASRLAKTCRDAELVARIGGDEFAVLLSADLNNDAIRDLASRIVEAVRMPVTRNGRTLMLGASVGIARAGAGSSSEWFVQADIALYAAKAAGRNTFRFYRGGDTSSRAVG